ncbi:hypothetical protein EVAR_55016_1 [Eumeta japonica]|uniref:Uncharacterized protein n=1 Tax=Eumeta variegata TaxID=151549 RepID=A0A4C1YDY2_EUMVA|nr:hypothetical protein EVAR_55016_1 [Eumeta japonica]
MRSGMTKFSDAGRLAGSPETETWKCFGAHPQEIADSHIHQGARSVKTTNTTSLSGPLSCNSQRATKTFYKAATDHYR